MTDKSPSPTDTGEPMTFYEMFEYLRTEGIERIYRNPMGFWLYPKDEDGEVNYDAYKSTGPYVTLEEAIHAGARR